MKQGFVYWIHKKEHTDIFSQGYIGITNNIVKRWNSHKSLCSGCIHLANAISLYGAENLIWEVIFTGSYDMCKEKEKSFRPSHYIGWNIIPGGQSSTSIKGKHHSKEAKEKISNSNKGKTHSEEARKKISKANENRIVSDETKSKMSNSHKGRVNKVSLANLHPPKGVPVLCVETNKVYLTAKAASKDLNINHSNIIQVCKGIRKSAGNYTWQYIIIKENYDDS